MKRELTGKHVLAIALGAFGTIIAVNLVMAFFAVSSFPGLEVRNSYVASQSFDRDRAAQQALGWTARPSYENGHVSLWLADATGAPARASDVVLTMGRPTHGREDVTPALRYEGGLWIGEADLAPGAWVAQIRATAPDGTLFRQRIDSFPGNRVQ